MEIRSLVLLFRFCRFDTGRILCLCQLFTDAFPFFLHLGSRHIFLAEFAEIFHSLIGKILRFSYNSACFFVGFPENLVALCVQFILLDLHFGFHAFHLPTVGSNFIPLFFNGFAACLQIGQQILKGFVLLTQTAFGILNDVRGESELLRNCKRVTLSGNSDQ